VGVHYQNSEDPKVINCQFDAALYLYIGGILGIIMHGFGVVTAFATWCAERDGVVTEGEKCGLGMLKCVVGCASFFVVIGELVILIWGSIVVFGNYADWTDDKEKIADDKLEYCHYTPFMFAFCLLIIKWVLIALVPVCVCCCTPCLIMAGLASKDN